MPDSLLPALLLLIASVVLPVVVARQARPDAVPSPFVGLRTRATMANPQAWRIAHRAARPWAIGSGAVSGVLALVAIAGALTGRQPLTVAGIAGSLLVFIAGAVVAAVTGERAALRTEPPGPAEP